MNLGSLFQGIGEAGGQIADARILAPQLRLQQLLDKIQAQMAPLQLQDLQERLRRLKLEPDTPAMALQQKLASYEQILGHPLTDKQKELLLGLEKPQTSLGVEDVERYLDRKMTDIEKQRFFGIAPKEAAPKAVAVTPVPGTSEPYKITDAEGKTWNVDDPNLPPDLKEELSSYRKAQKLGEEKKETIEARKNAEAINRALQIKDYSELVKGREEIRKLTHRAISGHSFLKTVAQEVAQAEATGGRGTKFGDMLIAEGFMQLMFGVDPKALRGSPKMMQSILEKAGGWDERSIAEMNKAISGGQLSQNVRQQILEASQRQVTSWDQAVFQAGQLVEDPKTKSMIERYMKVIEQGNSLSDLGGKPIP